MFLSVNILDRYLSKRIIEKEELALVAIAAMLVASKFEEIYPPEIRDFVHACNKAFLKDDILIMEVKVLKCLNYDIVTASPFRFLERYSLSIEPDEKCFYLAQYFLELSLIDTRLNYPSSMKATSSIILARKFLKQEPALPYNLQKSSGYPREMLENCIRDFCTIIESSKKSFCESLKVKFSSPKYLEVSKIYS